MSKPFDASLLTLDQAMMGLAMLGDHATAHHARTKSIISMFRLKMLDDPQALIALDEWEALEERDYAALQRSLERLPECSAPAAKPILN